MTFARPEGRLVRRAAPWACLAAVTLVVPLALSGCTSAEPPKVVDTYGGLPSYLPKPSGGTDGILTGSVAKPALTSEGDSVKVTLPGGGTVLATVTGPVVPGEGLPYQGKTTTCTWTIELSDATRDVPLSLTDLTTLDQLGNVYRLATVPSKPAPPAVLRAGASTTFDVRATMKTGEGLLRWAPGGGGSQATGSQAGGSQAAGSQAGGSAKIVASWDFEVEND